MGVRTKRITFAIARILMVLAFLAPVWTDICFCQVAGEYVYAMLPVGGWNVIGPSSVRGTGMAETVFGNACFSPGYLNPARLGSLGKISLALSGKLASTVYRSEEGGFPDLSLIDFSRTTSSPDFAGIGIPIGRWTVAASYYLFQDLTLPFFQGLSYLDYLEQSGKIHGINVAVSCRVTSDFSAGLSVSYLFGKMSRFQKRDMNVEESYDVDIAGAAINFGFVFVPGKKWSFGLVLRPPAKLGLDTRVALSYPFWDPPDEFYARNTYFRQPFVAVSSCAFNPVEDLEFTADLSLWTWGHTSASFVAPIYGGGSDELSYFKDVLKLNVGAECGIPLRIGEATKVMARAGYIYDTQPVPYWGPKARNFLTVGLGLSGDRISIDAAVKIPMFTGEAAMFHSHIYQIELGYRF
jgi:hypothetical protein